MAELSLIYATRVRGRRECPHGKSDIKLSDTLGGFLDIQLLCDHFDHFNSLWYRVINPRTVKIEAAEEKYLDFDTMFSNFSNTVCDFI